MGRAFGAWGLFLLPKLGVLHPMSQGTGGRIMAENVSRNP